MAHERPPERNTTNFDHLESDFKPADTNTNVFGSQFDRPKLCRSSVVRVAHVVNGPIIDFLMLANKGNGDKSVETFIIGKAMEPYSRTYELLILRLWALLSILD